MNQNNSKTFQFNFSNLRFWISLVAIILLLRSLGLGGLVNGFFIIIALAIATPILGILWFTWWAKRNQVQAPCPVCNAEISGFNGTEVQCPSCSEPLKIENRIFQRLTPPGTIDVQAVEVSNSSRD